MPRSPEWRSSLPVGSFSECASVNIRCTRWSHQYTTQYSDSVQMVTHPVAVVRRTELYWVGYGWRGEQLWCLESVNGRASHSLNMCSCLLCSSSSSTLSYSSFMSPSSSSSTSSHDSSKCLLTSPSAVSRGSPGRIHSPTNQRPPCQLARKWDIRGPGKT